MIVVHANLGKALLSDVAPACHKGGFQERGLNDFEAYGYNKDERVIETIRGIGFRVSTATLDTLLAAPAP
jgi:hypothetical protein